MIQATQSAAADSASTGFLPGIFSMEGLTLGAIVAGLIAGVLAFISSWLIFRMREKGKRSWLYIRQNREERAEKLAKKGMPSIVFLLVIDCMLTLTASLGLVLPMIVQLLLEVQELKESVIDPLVQARIDVTLNVMAVFFFSQLLYTLGLFDTVVLARKRWEKMQDNPEDRRVDQ
jgi:hypothetical protein